jgi:predicted flap endonuclease-1-like 5' DNA nuclease
MSPEWPVDDHLARRHASRQEEAKAKERKRRTKERKAKGGRVRGLALDDLRLGLGLGKVFELVLEASSTRRG